MNLDTYEQSLLTELRHHVAVRAAESPAKRPVYRRRAAWIAAPATVVAAAGVAIGLSLTQSSAAFAVEKASDGDITVTINRYDDATGLEQALAADGVTSVVDYSATAATPDNPPPADDTQACAPRGADDVTADDGGHNSASFASDGAFSLTIPASIAGSGAVLHISLGGQPGPGHASSLAIGWTC